MTIYEGKQEASEGRFAIIVARFNETITTRLLNGSVDTLRAAGVSDEQIDVVWIPGAFEIPTVAERLAASKQYVAVICLGAVIRGETSHDEHINRAVSVAISKISMRHDLPVIFGVLTCNTVEQANARSGGVASSKGKEQADSHVGNKGMDAAEAALEMIHLMSQLPPRA